MVLHILGSNSLGNCYILENESEALIIEAGIRMPKVKKALQFKLNKVVGAIITHQHNDHAGFVKELVTSGVVVFALQDVLDAKGLGESFTHAITPGKGFKVGGFKVLPLPVKHDVPCVGYVVMHEEIGRLLFITDTVGFDFNIGGLNTIMIEANYADDLVDGNIASGAMPPCMKSRLYQSHMGLNETKNILNSLDLSKVNNIILIHLSNGNSDERRFVQEVTDLTGKSVMAANAGMNVDISLNPY